MLNSSKPWTLLAVICFPMLLAGCGSGSSSSDQAETAKPSIKKIDAEKLPELGPYMPPLDGQRLEIAPPADWNPAPRTKDYVVRFRPANPSDDFPMILVTAEDYATPDELDAEFIEAIAKKEKADKAAGLSIGDFVGASYAKRAKDPKAVSKIIELRFLTTSAAGRLYRLELRAREGEVEKSLNDLYAVANSIRFPTEEGDNAAAADTIDVAANETKAGSDDKPAEPKGDEAAPPDEDVAVAAAPETNVDEGDPLAELDEPVAMAADASAEPAKTEPPKKTDEDKGDKKDGEDKSDLDELEDLFK